jgi:hypothetical protein
MAAVRALALAAGVLPFVSACEGLCERGVPTVSVRVLRAGALALVLAVDAGPREEGAGWFWVRGALAAATLRLVAELAASRPDAAGSDFLPRSEGRRGGVGADDAALPPRSAGRLGGVGVRDAVVVRGLLASATLRVVAELAAFRPAAAGSGFAVSGRFGGEGWFSSSFVRVW